jgi:general secretion pathway protein E
MDLVEFLTARGRLDRVQGERVLALRRELGDSDSIIVTRLGMIGEREMAELLAEFLAIPLATIADYPAEPLLPGDLTADFIARARALPLTEAAEGLALAMADPTDDYTLKAVRLAAGRPVLPWAAVPSELNAAIERLHGKGGADPIPHSGRAVAAPADM